MIKAEALFDYTAANEKEISLTAGEQVQVLEKNERRFVFDKIY